MYAGSYFLLCWGGMMEIWDAELLFWGLGGRAESEFDSLLTSTGNRAICSVPIPLCPLKRLQMYSAPICHSWECGGVSIYVPTSADGTTPPLWRVSAPPQVTLLPYYSFILSLWWIMMLLPYLVCRGNHTHASVAHWVAFHSCAGSFLIGLLTAPPNWAWLNFQIRISSSLVTCLMLLRFRCMYAEKLDWRTVVQ